MADNKNSLTFEQQKLHKALTRIFGSISLVPLIFLIIFVIIRKNLWNNTNFILIQICVSVIIYIFSFYFPLYKRDDDNDKSNPACTVQFFIFLTFSLCLVIFLCVSYLVYYLEFKEHYLLNSKAKFIFLCIISWALGFLIGIFFVFVGKTNPTFSGICWIESKIMEKIYFAIFFIFFAINIVLIFIFRAEVVRKCNEIGAGNIAEQFSKRLYIFLIISLPIYLPYVIPEFISLFHTFRPPWLRITRDTLSASIGIFIFIGYGFFSAIYFEMKCVFGCATSEEVNSNQDEKAGELSQSSVLFQSNIQDNGNNE